ncbi:hypothetical protein SHKM778_40190 [Streptomyces sp. KM77-8]|uniref:Uncharacterized protein n=1 Tax=Streptomyces haneummycinicus TaxID=3074435 RepID=A0AAT9HJC1_9ACTN
MPDTELTVTMSGGGVADARAVVGVLEETFGTAAQRPRGVDATVRVATFAGEGAAAPGGRRRGRCRRR